MNKINDLAEQHILESQARLRHIDELMAKARTAPLNVAVATQAESVLSRFESDRNRLARELHELEQLPHREASEVVKRAEGLKGVLETVGLQLERALGTIFQLDK